jgi:hypothetical protein
MCTSTAFGVVVYASVWKKKCNHFSLASCFQATEMLSKSGGSIPFIFLVTDGAVEDERHICDIMKSHITGGGSIHPRICTFGIGNGFLCFIGGTDGILSA